MGKQEGLLERAVAFLANLGALWTLVVSFAPGIAATVWAYFGAFPGPFVPVVFVFGLAGGLWLYNGIADLKKSRAFDYVSWDLVNEFTFQHAANLWVGERPYSGFNDSATAIYKMLVEQASSRSLKANKRGYALYAMDSEVMRADLVELAKRVGQRPKFLFKDAR